MPQLDSGSGHMDLAADAADLPLLQPFDSTSALMTANLDPAWSIAKLYASDLAVPPTSDALVLRNRKGGEYAQFYCVDDATLPREARAARLLPDPRLHRPADRPPRRSTS